MRRPEKVGAADYSIYILYVVAVYCSEELRRPEKVGAADYSIIFVFHNRTRGIYFLKIVLIMHNEIINTITSITMLKE